MINEILFYKVPLVNPCLQLATEYINQEYNHPEEPSPPVEGEILQQDVDINPIPDIVSTGITVSEPSLIEVTGAGTYGEVPFVVSGGTKLAMNMYSGVFQGTDVQLTCEGYDFRNYPCIVLNSNQITDGNGRNLTVTFRNCWFDSFTPERECENVRLVFENCNVDKGLSNSGFDFDYCAFFGTIQDSVRPLKHVHGYNSYIYDKAHASAEINYHTDGIQFFGYNGIDSEDVEFDNVRIDVPQLKFSGNNGTYANASIMLQMESSSANGISFKNMKINGGGHDVYSWAQGAHTLSNILFENVRYGVAHRYSPFYSGNDNSVDYSDVQEQNKLFVSTLKRDGSGNTDLYVTNYTNTQRDIVIVTNLGTTTHTINACLEYADFVEDVTTFFDFPFNVKIQLPNEVDWVVCYDTADATENQIRFVNWSGQPVIR